MQCGENWIWTVISATQFAIYQCRQGYRLHCDWLNQCLLQSSSVPMGTCALLLLLHQLCVQCVTLSMKESPSISVPAINSRSLRLSPTQSPLGMSKYLNWMSLESPRAPCFSLHHLWTHPLLSHFVPGLISQIRDLPAAPRSQQQERPWAIWVGFADRFSRPRWVGTRWRNSTWSMWSDDIIISIIVSTCFNYCCYPLFLQVVYNHYCWIWRTTSGSVSTVWHLATSGTGPAPQWWAPGAGQDRKSVV